MQPDDISKLLNRRKAYFVIDSIRSEDGNLVPCIAIEKEPGYFRTDWEWGKSLTDAEKYAAQMNARLGLTSEDAAKIVLSTMRPVTFH